MTNDGTADQRPRLAEILAVWTAMAPHSFTPDEVVAAWFALKVDLLAPITADPDHPEYDQARHFAAKAVQSANALWSKGEQR